MKDMHCRLLVIGAGPGGYVCAIRAGQIGVDSVIVEAAKIGGTCLNVGCIPSKALIHAADEFERARLFAAEAPIGVSVSDPKIDFAKTMAWKDGIVRRLRNGVSGLLKKAKVKTVRGRAQFLDGKTVSVETDAGEQIISAENIVIATGSTPAELPLLPFGGRVISSTQALSMDGIPDRLVVVGGGYIGLEIGTALAKLGARVSIVEAFSRVLPRYDGEVTRPIAKRLHELGVVTLTNTRAKGLSADGGALIVEADDGARQELAADRVLVAVGRRAQTKSLESGRLSLQMDGEFIHIDECCRTSMRGVYAIGDVTGEPMLAHRAMAQGEMVAEIIAGHNRIWDHRCIPAVCFTDPELVSAGLSPQQAEADGIDIETGTFPFQANARAMTMERGDGMVRVVCRADNHVILGIQAVGAGIADFSSNFSLAIEMGARLEDIAGTIHAHPTRSEALREASLRALGRALHI